AGRSARRRCAPSPRRPDGGRSRPRGGRWRRACAARADVYRRRRPARRSRRRPRRPARPGAAARGRRPRAASRRRRRTPDSNRRERSSSRAWSAWRRAPASGSRLGHTTRPPCLDTLKGRVLFAHMPAAPLLRTERLTRAFGSLIAVDRVDVTIHQGELRSIIGPNGAGKTTFFRLISGEMAPSSGRIFFGDRDITGLPQHAVARLGVAKSYQITNVFPHLSVHENVRVAVQGHARAFNFWSRADALTEVSERAT